MIALATVLVLAAVSAEGSAPGSASDLSHAAPQPPPPRAGLPIAPPSPAPPAPPPPPQLYKVNLAVDLPLTVVAGSVALVRVFGKEDLARKTCPCATTGVNALDRHAIGNHSHTASVAADITVYGTMAALPLLDLIDVGANRALAEDLVVFAETIAIDTALQNAVNFAVGRPRPATYARDPEFLRSGEGYLSFYAGHVSTAFSMMSAASVTLRRRHGAGIWPWIVTAALAGSVAVERVASGHHFPSDVATAAVAGTAIGITVPWLHARERSAAVSVVPARQGSGLALVGSF